MHRFEGDAQVLAPSIIIECQDDFIRIALVDSILRQPSEAGCAFATQVVVSSVFVLVTGIVFGRHKCWKVRGGLPTGIARGYSELDWSALGLPSSAFAGA